jgi:HD superfamily phosphohydrolase
MILRDAVHGLVSFETPVEQIVCKLVDTREVQRLRRVKMLGVTSFAFPGAEHSRFAHAVGAAHVMTQYLARMRQSDMLASPNEAVSEQDERLALAAALLHDVGHGPLSHLFEEVFEALPRHEVWSRRLLLDHDSDIHRVLCEYDRALPAEVARLIDGDHDKPWLAHAVSGTFDVDRCDYLLRDSYMTGVRYGMFDLPWLLRSLRLLRSERGELVLGVDGSKGLPAVEGFFLSRLFMYQQVYFHKASRAAERMVRALFARAAELENLGRGRVLPPTLAALARGESLSSREYIALDDSTLWSVIDAWSDNEVDPILSDLSTRLKRRQLFKSATLDDDDSVPEEMFEALKEIVARAGFDPRYYAALDAPTTPIYDEPAETSEAMHVWYQRRPAKLLSRASLLLGKLKGERLTPKRLFFPEQVRESVATLLGREPQLSLSL